MSERRIMVDLADERLVERLKERAEQEQRSMAVVVRRILWRAVRNQKKPVDSMRGTCEE